MQHKKGPFILLALLIISLSFLLGVQYGKRVQLTDKAIEEIVKTFPTPTPPPSPSQAPRSYDVFTSNACALSFVYPADYTISATGTQSASVKDPTNRSLFEFGCGASLSPLEESSATTTVLIPLNGKEYKGSLTKSDGSIMVSFLHPRRSTPVTLVISSELEALVERTIQFLP